MDGGYAANSKSGNKYRVGGVLTVKKFLISIIVVISMLMTVLSVFADGIKVSRDIEKETFTVSGMAEENSVVRVIVAAPNKKYSDAVGALNPFDIIKYQREIDVTDEKGYTFEVELSGASGVYTAYIASDGTVSEAELEYINPDNYALTVKGLNETADIESYIKDNRDDLGFFLKLYDSVDKAEVCGKIKKALPLDGSKIEEAVAVFNSAVIMTAVKEKDIEGISGYADKIYMLNNGSVADNWYKKADKALVDKRINGSFETVKAFEDKVCEAVVLSIIEKPNGYLNVKNVINDFKNEIGISSPTAKDEVYKKLSGQNLASYSALKKKYGEILDEIPADGGGNSGGGGGGGGGGSSKPQSNVISPTINDNKVPLPEAEKPIIKEYFTDLGNADWAKTACESLAEKGILSGKSEGIFAPLDNITREEFVAIIVRAFGVEKVVSDNEFSDISVNDWCYDYILAASQNNIIGGIGDGLFGKGQNITRQDMAVILHRVITAKGAEIGGETQEISFADETAIADYAKDAVKYLSSRQIINGMGNGTFSGKENASRAQAAQMIYNLLEKTEV